MTGCVQRRFLQKKGSQTEDTGSGREAEDSGLALVWDNRRGSRCGRGRRGARHVAGRARAARGRHATNGGGLQDGGIRSASGIGGQHAVLLCCS